jgi:Kdo2-lipid IVA lauroyltransferase/acyltransferase
VTIVSFTPADGTGCETIEFPVKIIYRDSISKRPLMQKTGLKTLRYQAWDFATNILLAVAIFAFRRLPPRSFVMASRVTGRISSFLLREYRERVITNLSYAYGKEKDLREIKKIMKEVFYHLALTGFETVYGMARPLNRLREIKIEGKEHLDAALALGNGVIAIGAHIGSFTFLGSRLGMEGYKVNIIIDMGIFPKIWGKINQMQREYGENPFPSKPLSLSLMKSLSCLRRNEILYILADQQQRRGGIAVSFFGRKAFTPPGPAIFSLKTGAPVLPMFVLREDAMHRTLVIGKPIDLERTSDEKKDLERLTAKITEAIEDVVRHYPAQWAWINRRWKLPRPEATLDREVGTV